MCIAQNYCHDQGRDTSVEPINESPEKQWGRPLLLGEEMVEQMKWFLKDIRQSGDIVNLSL